MKIAILEASHWHVPLYLDALAADQAVEVVAVSDARSARGPAIARRFGARSHESWQALLDAEALDFVFAFGRHDEMPAIAQALIERGLPFAIEKPGGLDAAQVWDLAGRAAGRGLFVAVPLIFGFSSLPRCIADIAGEAGTAWRHLSFRFIAGPIERYLDNDCPWMLARRTAGGGCAINLAVHFVDLVMRLTGEGIRSVTARMIQDPGVAEVEIYAQLALETDGGQLCTVETGYTYPGGTEEQRDFSFSLASRDFYLRSGNGGFRCVPRDGSPARQIRIGLETDIFYGEFVRRTLQELRAGDSPFAGLPDLARVMDVIDCAYESNSRGGAPVAVPPTGQRTGAR